ncbi:class I SAM-dependent methyltransferase [Halocatena halophila]|uniref:hypothetical protein n=1 Tax=Halocatena halophila TaxID=2814576 RepID=UPI002ED32773
MTDTPANKRMVRAEFTKQAATYAASPVASDPEAIGRLALHHIEIPVAVVREMTRVCRPAGTVGIADLVVSEHAERGKYQNEFEWLRDPSHVRALRR